MLLHLLVTFITSTCSHVYDRHVLPEVVTQVRATRVSFSLHMQKSLWYEALVYQVAHHSTSVRAFTVERM